MLVFIILDIDVKLSKWKINRIVSCIPMFYSNLSMPRQCFNLSDCLMRISLALWWLHVTILSSRENPETRMTGAGSLGSWGLKAGLAHVCIWYVTLEGQCGRPDMFEKKENRRFLIFLFSIYI